jgi:hypothetical protein
MSSGYDESGYAGGEYEGGGEWSEAQWDDAGNSYWYNDTTGETAYEDPHGGYGAEAMQYDEPGYGAAAYAESDSQAAAGYEASAYEETGYGEAKLGGSAIETLPEEVYEEPYAAAATDEPYPVEAVYVESELNGEVAYQVEGEYVEGEPTVEVYTTEGAGEGGDDGPGQGELPWGWEAKYDESMGGLYYLNEASGEASWVRPELPPELAAASAPVRDKWEAAAKPTYDYDEVPAKFE